MLSAVCVKLGCRGDSRDAGGIPGMQALLQFVWQLAVPASLGFDAGSQSCLHNHAAGLAFTFLITPRLAGFIFIVNAVSIYVLRLQAVKNLSIPRNPHG